MKQLEERLVDISYEKGYVTKAELTDLSQRFDVSYDILLELSKKLNIDVLSKDKIINDINKLENQTSIKEINSPLLTKEEELQLFKKLESLREDLSKLNKDNPLDLKLYKQTKKEIDNIKLLIMNKNTAMIKFIARKFNTHNLQFDDLVSEGKLGMQAAIEVYDYKSNARFATYAYYKVYQAIRRAIQNYDRSIRIPVHMVELTTKIIKCRYELSSKLGYSPSSEEIAEALKITVKEVERCLHSSNTVLSLDNTIDDDNKTALQDILSDPITLSPYELSVKTYIYDEIMKALESIDQRERLIFIERYGLIDFKPQRLDKLGIKYNLSKERIRQIIEGVKRKLNILAPHLKEFANGGKDGK